MLHLLSGPLLCGMGRLLGDYRGPHPKEANPMGLTGNRFETYDKRI